MGACTSGVGEQLVGMYLRGWENSGYGCMYFRGGGTASGYVLKEVGEQWVWVHILKGVEKQWWVYVLKTKIER